MASIRIVSSEEGSFGYFIYTIEHSIPWCKINQFSAHRDSGILYTGHDYTYQEHAITRDIQKHFVLVSILLDCGITLAGTITK